MKIQRSIGVNGKRSECIALIRVVPPSFGPFGETWCATFLCVNSEPSACGHARPGKQVRVCLLAYRVASAVADAFGERRINEERD